MKKSVFFYHIRFGTKAPLLAQLLAKTLQQNYKAIIRTPDLQHSQELSDFLWEHPAFLPHALPEDDFIPQHPLYITSCLQNIIQADFLFLYGDVPTDYKGYQRVFILFEDIYPDEMQKARQFWLDLKDNHDYQKHYWQQNDSQKWEERIF